MYRILQETFGGPDKDLPQRCFDICMRQRVIDGTLYDKLKHAFHDEKNSSDEYIPLRDRRPSVRYGLCRIVVDDSVAMLFSEGHWPGIDYDDEKVREVLQQVVKESRLNEVMIHAATRGSVGSVVVLMRVLSNRVFFSVMETAHLTPTWKSDAPDTLEKVTEKYKVKGSALADSGYEIPDDETAADFWFQREWDESAETWFHPWKVSDKTATPVIDEQRTVKHSLGFVPMVWIKNLPGGDEVDGTPTFPPEAIDTGIEIDYQLSQAGRGLKYSSDPTLLIKEPATSDGTMVRSASNAIVVNSEGDAKLLEIDGTAVAAVLDYVRGLRELALETMHGNRSNADKVSAAQSGRAMELMHASLINLADKLRISYGEGGLLELLTMVCKVSSKIALNFKDGTKIPELKLKKPLALRWPAWFAPTSEDRQTDATTIKTLVEANVLSRETATKIIAPDYDIEDVSAERSKADAERKERDESAKRQVKITE